MEILGIIILLLIFEGLASSWPRRKDKDHAER
jgi:hypothetical protein